MYLDYWRRYFTLKSIKFLKLKALLIAKNLLMKRNVEWRLERTHESTDRQAFILFKLYNHQFRNFKAIFFSSKMHRVAAHHKQRHDTIYFTINLLQNRSKKILNVIAADISELF